jgi:hypothetical protein
MLTVMILRRTGNDAMYWSEEDVRLEKDINFFIFGVAIFVAVIAIAMIAGLIYTHGDQIKKPMTCDECKSVCVRG